MPDQTQTGGRWTERDELASRFMQAWISGRLAGGQGLDPNFEALAHEAYGAADAFMKVRGRGSGP
ncbi:hypothetical protein [Anaeromyxobacter oryzae]|uniref:DUF768 domain-containing protein n=1 Tax=Anaeromyxobacter oryzae TaxID=2918170 RepID=A0ABM7WZU3_9BACT|nr:hypothetical protein [Anaeromyxobacter oryzae]BDG04974.1 hypothetical protein AMOR_39700 [Anaeromyxobacter oryzae]